MKKIEKKRKKKIIFLFIWFFFLAIFLSTMTYAWFSSNRIVDLQFFDIHVETDGGLEISENGIDWKNELTVDDLKSAYKTYANCLNQIPGTMKPMSSGGLVDNQGYLSLYFGKADSNGTKDYYLTATRKIEERTTDQSNNGDFIVFDVFFKTTAPKSLYLSSKSNVIFKGDESLGIENSSRIAFVNEGNTSIDNNINVIQNLKTNNPNSAVIWEPNYDVHTEHGVDNAKKTYGIDTTLTNAQILPYDGVIKNIESSDNVTIGDANSTNYPNLFKKVKVGIYTKKDYNNNNYLLELNAGITKLRIYMWLEGQDVDSENRASHGDITYFIEFTLNP